MPDPDETPEPGTPEPAPEPAKSEPDTPDRLPDDHPLVKAYQATKNELTNAKSKVKEFEDASKSDHEKLTDENSDLKGKLTTAEANAARYEIALEKGLTKSQAKRLVGTTREELEADAIELLEDLGVDEGEKPAPSSRPKERLKPGATPDAEPGEDPEKIADRILSKNRI